MKSSQMLASAAAGSTATTTTTTHYQQQQRFPQSIGQTRYVPHQNTQISSPHAYQKPLYHRTECSPPQSSTITPNNSSYSYLSSPKVSTVASYNSKHNSIESTPSAVAVTTAGSSRITLNNNKPRNSKENVNYVQQLSQYSQTSFLKAPAATNTSTGGQTTPVNRVSKPTDYARILQPSNLMNCGAILTPKDKAKMQENLVSSYSSNQQPYKSNYNTLQAQIGKPIFLSATTGSSSSSSCGSSSIITSSNINNNGSTQISSASDIFGSTMQQQQLQQQDISVRLSLSRILDSIGIHENQLNTEQQEVRDCLQILLNRIESVKSDSQTSIEKVQSAKRDVNTLLESEKNRLNTSFEQWMGVIDAARRRALSDLEESTRMSTQQLEIGESTMKQQVSDATKIRSDIHENIENIFTNLELKPFQVIFKKYSDKLDVFQANIGKTNGSSIKLKMCQGDALARIARSIEQTFADGISIVEKIASVNKTADSATVALQDFVIFNPSFGGSHCNQPTTNHESFQAVINAAEKVESGMLNSRGNSIVYVSFNNKNIFENTAKENQNQLQQQQQAITESKSSLINDVSLDNQKQPPLLSVVIDDHSAKIPMQQLFESGASTAARTMLNESAVDRIYVAAARNSGARSSSPSRNSSQLAGSMNNNNNNSSCRSPNSVKYLELIDKINANQQNTNIFYSTLIKEAGVLGASQSNMESGMKSSNFASAGTFSLHLSKQNPQTAAAKTLNNSRSSSESQRILTSGATEKLAMSPMLTTSPEVNKSMFNSQMSNTSGNLSMTARSKMSSIGGTAHVRLTNNHQKKLF